MGWVTFVRRRVISGEGITWLPLALHPIIVERSLHICHVLHESHRHVTLNAKARDDVTPTAHEASLILPVTCFSKRVWWKDEHIPCQVFLGVCMWLLFVFPPSTVIGLDRHALTRCRAGLDNTLRWAVYFRSWDSVHSFTPASANEKQLAADSTIKIYALLLYSYEYKLYEWNGTEVCFAFIMCIYFSMWFMCQHTSDFLHVGSNVYLIGLALLFVWALPHLLLDCLHLRVLCLQLTQKICAASDCLLGLPNSPAAVLLLNPACVIHHMLSWAVKSNHDKCCFSSHETTVLASHFKPPLSSCALHLQNLFCGRAAP